MANPTVHLQPCSSGTIQVSKINLWKKKCPTVGEKTVLKVTMHRPGRNLSSLLNDANWNAQYQNACTLDKEIVGIPFYVCYSLYNSFF